MSTNVYRSTVLNSRGFTVIETVIAIVLVGILSAVTISRFLQSDTYNPSIARDQIISLSRSAQQKAISRADVTLTIQPVGNQLEIRLADGDGEIESATVDNASLILRGDVNELDGCEVTDGVDLITNAAPFVLEYDELGDLLRGGVTGSTGYPVAVSTGARICLNADAAMSICWSAAGYAYIGDCVE